MSIFKVPKRRALRIMESIRSNFFKGASNVGDKISWIALCIWCILTKKKGRKSLPKDEFAHLRIPLENILSATNSFADENVIGRDGIGNRYQGQLLWSGELIEINARRLNKDLDDGEQLLWMEISMLSTLKHKNVVSLVGFCDENDEKIIIIRSEMRGSLKNYLSDPMLTWVRRLEISVGVAHALSYIHHEEARDFSLIHRNITSNTVLLNDDWEPKLSNFERSMKIKAYQRHYSFRTNKLEYVNGYGDPTYLETKNVSHKSDMYSFGIVLFELLCNRDLIIGNDQDNNKLITNSFQQFRGKQACIAFEKMEKGGERSQRLSIDEIVPRIEKALELQLKSENAANEHTTVVADKTSTYQKNSCKLVRFYDLDLAKTKTIPGGIAILTALVK
ncbi:kinase-like domain, phloem protein 2-like protein [Tanacetum coccineum]